MTSGFIEAEKASFPISRMCRVQSGPFAWQDRAAWRPPLQDMVDPARIHPDFMGSNGTCGAPRMPPISSMRVTGSGDTAGRG